MLPPSSLPTDTETGAAPTVRLCSSRQIFAAAIIGSPVAACWFMAQNYRRLGQPGCARNWLFWGIGGTVVAFSGLCLLPFADRIPNYVIPIAYSLALQEAARKIHGAAVRQHLSAGGRLVSWGAVVGISFLIVLGVIGLLLPVVYLASLIWP